MATVKQIQFRLRLAKKKLTGANKVVTATKNKIKKLETQLNKAKAAEKAAKTKKKKKKPAKRSKSTRRRKSTAKKATSKK